MPDVKSPRSATQSLEHRSVVASTPQRSSAQQRTQALTRNLAALEAGLIITAWPSCPPFASRRVDQLTLRQDKARAALEMRAIALGADHTVAELAADAWLQLQEVAL